MVSMENGNRVILGFTNIYNESEDENSLLRQVYDVSHAEFRSAYGNGHDFSIMRPSYEATATRRGFTFEEVLGAALVKTQVKAYNIEVTTDNGATNVALNFNATYSEDFYFELVGNIDEEKEYKITITDTDGNESWRIIKATRREIWG